MTGYRHEVNIGKRKQEGKQKAENKKKRKFMIVVMKVTKVMDVTEGAEDGVKLGIGDLL